MYASLPTLALAILLSLFSGVLSSFVTFEPTDWTSKVGFANVPVRYRSVPNGICELNSTVKSFSGYADVAKDQHVFFWFFESRTVSPAKAPLTVWMSGGAGISSMVGLFNENGPCRIDHDMKVINNPWSMTEVSNVLYIDQPGDVGLSYSNPVPGFINPETHQLTRLPRNACPSYAQQYGTCGTYGYPDPAKVINSTTAAAPVFYKAIQGFLGAFPKYARNQINVATSGFGGNYAPVYSQYFDKRNKNLRAGSAATKVTIESLSINAPSISPITLYNQLYNYTVNNPYDVEILPAADLDRLDNTINGEGNCLARAQKCNSLGRSDACLEAYTYCEGEIYSVLARSSRALDDIRYPTGAETTPTAHVAYLNQPGIRHAIGAYVTYNDFSYDVSRSFAATGAQIREGGMITAVQGMLKDGKAVLLTSGDADLYAPWTAVEAVANLVKPPRWSIARYANMTIPMTKSTAASTSVMPTGSSSMTIALALTTTTTSRTTALSSSSSKSTDYFGSSSTFAASPIIPVPTSSTSFGTPSGTTSASALQSTSFPALSTESGPAGVVKQANLFAFARLYNTGHSLGSYRPDVTYHIWKRFIQRTDIEKGEEDVYAGWTRDQYYTDGTKKSTYREGRAGLKG
ncbi:Serine carboxypeptidase-like protein 8 [Elsinoe fawcettii]|nr:Serine carboxypeptidase-like protein 8 [Elsinoe fawcettii]